MRNAAWASALLVCVLAVSVAPASATTRLRACSTDEATVSFSKGLTTQTVFPNSPGTATFKYTNRCASARDNGAVGLDLPYDGQITLQYSGSCLSARLTGGNHTGLIVGGTVMTIVTTGAPNGVSTGVISPLWACQVPRDTAIPIVLNLGADELEE